MTDIEHTGLYVQSSQIAAARQGRDSDETLKLAWRWLLAEPDTSLGEHERDNGEVVTLHKPRLTGLSAALADAYRYRFAEDDDAGERVVRYLSEGAGFGEQETLLDALMELLAAAHAFEMVRDHTAFTERKAWLKHFDVVSDDLLRIKGDDRTALEAFWQVTLRVVSGIVLEDTSRLERGIASFETTVNKEIHPEGYLRSLTDVPDKLSFHWHTLGVAALTLAAEAAAQVGVDAWAYENRGVGVSTSAAYLVYYYFYPDKWRWDDDITQEDTRAVFRQYGAWIEIVTYRTKVRSAELLLDEGRPFYSAYTGGLTTLSHAENFTPKRRGWFG